MWRIGGKPGFILAQIANIFRPTAQKDTSSHEIRVWLDTVQTADIITDQGHMKVCPGVNSKMQHNHSQKNASTAEVKQHLLLLA